MSFGNARQMRLRWKTTKITDKNIPNRRDPISLVGRLLHSLQISYNSSKQKIFGWVGEI